MLTECACVYYPTKRCMRRAKTRVPERGRWAMRIMRTLATGIAICICQQAAADVDSTGFRADLRCEDAYEAELEYGGKAEALSPRLGPWGSFGFKRLYNGHTMDVRYTCDAKGNVLAQVFSAAFDTEAQAHTAYDAHRSHMLKQLGRPCWDTSQLTAEQRGSIPKDYLFSLFYSMRTEWKPRPSIATEIHMNKAPSDVAWWDLKIITGPSRGSDPEREELELKVRAMGTCDLVTA
jgi:hypothetical protein